MNSDEMNEAYQVFIQERGVEVPCEECGGLGTKAYGNTSTWQGGAGGQTITNGPCNRCWGSGDEFNPWPSHRSFYWMKNELERIKNKFIRNK